MNSDSTGVYLGQEKQRSHPVALVSIRTGKMALLSLPFPWNACSHTQVTFERQLLPTTAWESHGSKRNAAADFNHHNFDGWR